jgi:hypothetical protein
MPRRDDTRRTRYASISSGKAATNKQEYPCIVAIAIAGKGLDIGLSRRIIVFHKTRHIQLRAAPGNVPHAVPGAFHLKLCREYRQAAGAVAPVIRRLSGAAAKKVEPRSSAEFGFLSLTLAFYVLGSMRELTKAKRALSI